MINRSNTELFHDFDLIIENVNNHVAAGLEDEIESRKQRSSKNLGDKNFFMEQFAEKIAYSQRAKSEKVHKMIEKGILRDAFCDFKVETVATLDAKDILTNYWDGLKVILVQSKIKKIIGCAKALKTIEKDGQSMKNLLKDIPRSLDNLDGVENFWIRFEMLRYRLDRYEMPFFNKTTSLLHLLLDLGYYCLKPDSKVMSVASKGLKMIPYREKGLFPDREREYVVRKIQEYSIEKRMRPEVIDLYLLIEGRQTWAKDNPFVTIDYRPKFGPY